MIANSQRANLQSLALALLLGVWSLVLALKLANWHWNVEFHELQNTKFTNCSKKMSTLVVC